MRCLTIAILIMFFGGAAIAQNKTYTDEANRFSVRYYGGWKVEQKDVQGFHISSGTSSVMIHRNYSQEKSLEFHNASLQEMVSQNYPGFKVVSQGIEKISGIDGKWFEGEMKHQGEKAYIRIYSVVFREDLYTLSLVSDQYESKLGQFISMVKSFRIKGSNALF